jgi:predicted GIY-YIG superfamily endonuclease
MHSIYLLRSTTHHGKTYIGLTDDLPKRLFGHNQGNTPFTAKYRPWKLVMEIRFSDPARAEAFETYLKSGSGRAFAAKHFW